MQTANRYADRRNAGQALAALFAPLAGVRDVIIVGLPQGGLIVAAELAEALRAPLDVYPMRMIASPAEPELTIGALGSGGVQVLDERLVQERALDPVAIETAVSAQLTALHDQEKFYRQFQPEHSFAEKIVILVDDGAGTGYSLVAAAAGVRARQAARVVVAVPVGSLSACAQLAEVSDDVMCPLQPDPFHAVGLWYVHFEPVSDDDAVQRLVAANAAIRHRTELMRPGRLRATS